MANETGLQGLMDFVGYPVGQPQPASAPNVPTAGLCGILDFVGYPVAGGAVRAGRGGGIGASRRRYLPLLMQLEMERSLLDHLPEPNRADRQKSREKEWRESVQSFEKTRTKKATEAAIYTALLSEC